MKDDWKRSPRRHDYQPRFDGNGVTAGGCYWCGRPESDHTPVDQRLRRLSPEAAPRLFDIIEEEA